MSFVTSSFPPHARAIVNCFWSRGQLTPNHPKRVLQTVRYPLPSGRLFLTPQTQTRARMSTSHVPTKTCSTCGRTITWRKKWERCWDDVKYCSDKCRKSKPSERDQQIEQAILDTLRQRPAGSSVCPSEIARAQFSEDQWRNQMERVRQPARRLVTDGHIVITQKGSVVDPSTAKGPIRLRLQWVSKFLLLSSKIGLCYVAWKAYNCLYECFENLKHFTEIDFQKNFWKLLRPK